MEEIEANFCKFDNYSLTNNQNDFLVKFDYSGNKYSLFVDKDSPCFYIDSLTVDTSPMNIDLVYESKIGNIVDLIKKNIPSNNDEKNERKRKKDNFGIFRERNVFSKCSIDYDSLQKRLEKSGIITELSVKSIPENLLYSRKQIVNIIINEIKMVNRDKSHPNYILPSDDDYIFEIHIPCKEIEIILKIKVDPDLYPFYPPSIKYILPNASQSLIYNFSNLSILKIENWNPTITMNWMIINISKEIEKYIDEHILCKEIKEVDDVDRKNIDILMLLGENLYQDINVSINYSKFVLKDTSNDNKYWKSGTGYGYGSKNEWDIKHFIKEKAFKDQELSRNLKDLYKLLDENNYLKVVNSPVFKYLGNSIIDSTLLEINSKPKNFLIVIRLIKKIFPWIQNSHYDLNKSIGDSLSLLSSDVKPLIEDVDDDFKVLYTEIINLKDYILNTLKQDSSKKADEKSIDDEKDKYSKYYDLVKSEQELMFDGYIIRPNHRFSKNKTDSLSPKVLMRISSEFSSLRKNLPNNWGSSIVLRGCSDNMNIFSFVIVGPEDTPYHNGVFEFHACFPSNYPEKEPKVLINTTGGGTVRFNPNLYDCGKVCLSLLGTWQGQDGESWNKQTSTFLQVLISIQSLILVDEPYYNEPGWERDMHSEAGMKKAFNYSDNIRYNTLKWAIVNQYENPPPGFENFIKQHFYLKKEEILDVTEKWIMESIKFKEEMTKLRDKFKSFFSDELNEKEVDSDEMSIDPPLYDTIPPKKDVIKKPKNYTEIELSSDSDEKGEQESLIYYESSSQTTIIENNNLEDSDDSKNLKV